MILYSHPTGNANVRQSLQALVESDLLTEFWTCINWNPHSTFAGLLPSGLARQFARRTFPETAQGFIRQSPWREAGRLFAPKLRLNALTRHETGPLSVDAVYRSLDHKAAARLASLHGIQGVYAGDDGALETFTRAKERDIKRFYDLPAGYWRVVQAICAEEKEREPAWAGTLKSALDSPGKLARKDEELSLADVVFVASTFTRETLRLAPHLTGKVHILPYGPPPVVAADQVGMDDARTLRVLFVGTLSQQKGLSYLLQAMDAVGKHAELTLIGKKPGCACGPLEDGLRKHRWIESLPHQEILAEMRRHDVLVLPSLSDGFGLVILEAMSQGLPVITTPNTGGPDVISDGRDGYIVPIRSAEAIEEKLSGLLMDRETLRGLKRAAWAKAGSLSWTHYRERLVEVFHSQLNMSSATTSGFLDLTSNR